MNEPGDVSGMSGTAKRRKGIARTSLVLGIVSVPTAGLLGLGAVASIVLGIIALVKVAGAPDRYGGKGMAIAGILCGLLSVVAAPLVLTGVLAILTEGSAVAPFVNELF